MNTYEGSDPLDHIELDSKTEELSLIAEQLTIIEKKYKQIPDTVSQRLTIPAVFGRTYDENFFSDYLAYILDPERNGIGIEPLQKLLSLVTEDIAEIEFDQVDIDREYTFEDPSLGRIDFLITLGEDGENGVIGIENKLYSSESKNQTIAYAKGFENDFNNCDHYLIFLSPYAHTPASRAFQNVRYEELLQVLCEIHYPVLNDIHKTVIWEDFLAHLEEYIVMSKVKLELSGKTRLYLDHRQVLIGLYDAYKNDAQKVYDFVIAAVKHSFGDGWVFNFKGHYPYQEIKQESWYFGKVYLFYQYLFSRDNLLINNRVPFMLGIYPKNANSKQFYEWFQPNYSSVSDLCLSRGIESFPTEYKGTQSYLIAYKEYPIAIDELTSIDQPFIQAVEEFSVFTPLIDDAIQAYKKTEI